jgi:putative oxidoreductase
MKHIPQIAATLLGLAFLTFGLNHWLKFLEMGVPPEGSPPYLFFGAIGPTGFLSFVKVLEIVGAILVIIPLTRNFGLLVLGPIVVNIIAINIYIMGGGAVFQPPVIAVSVLSAYLLWVERGKFLGLLKSNPAAA